MKKKNLNFLLALLAALALIFAAACDTGTNGGSSSDDGNNTDETLGEGGGCNNAECSVTGCTGAPGCSACAEADPVCECDECATVTINMTYIGSFLQALTGQIAAYDGADVGWTLAGGTWSSDNVTYTLRGYGSSGSTSPNTDGILEAVQELDAQTSEDGFLQIVFEEAAWDSEAPTDDAATGSITVQVTIASGANSNGYTISTTGDDSALENFASSGLDVDLVLTRELVSSGNWTSDG